VRAVLDPNVLIAAALSPQGSPARILRAWLDGAFELFTSPLLLEELERALSYPKLRQRISPDEAHALVALLRDEAELRPDPTGVLPARSTDPGDDYLIALAADSRAIIVSGDHHLLELADQLPVQSPVDFLAAIEPT